MPQAAIPLVGVLVLCHAEACIESGEAAPQVDCRFARSVRNKAVVVTSIANVDCPLDVGFVVFIKLTCGRVGRAASGELHFPGRVAGARLLGFDKSCVRAVLFQPGRCSPCSRKLFDAQPTVEASNSRPTRVSRASRIIDASLLAIRAVGWRVTRVVVVVKAVAG